MVGMKCTEPPFPTETKEPARVLAIVVAHNDRQWLDACFSSLIASSQPIDIVLIDNAPFDGASAFMRENFPQVKTITNSTNRGFAGGCNQGLAVGMANEYDYFFLVNPDTRCPQNLVAELAAFMDDHLEYGIVGPLQNCYQAGTRESTGELNHWARRALADPNTSYFARWIPRLRAAQPRPQPTPGVIDRSYVQGSALFMRRTVCDRIGMFDETYHTFHEEVDLCRRAWWSGFRIGLLTDFRIEHCARDLSNCTWYRAFHRTKNRYYFLVTEPSLRTGEALYLLTRWLWADLGTALSSSGRPAAKRMLAIPASVLWLLRHAPAIRHARRIRTEAYRRSPWSMPPEYVPA
jgi:GT2 family glycosyltransferase